MSTAPGWAIRRSGSCLLTEENDCGETAKPYRACCPSSSTCVHQSNTICCPANTNCTTTLIETPSCANRSWIIFINGGYFCCESGQVGYALGNSDGCSLSGIALPADVNPLAVINQVFSSTSTSTSVAPTSPFPTTASPTISPTTGATAKGVSQSQPKGYESREEGNQYIGYYAMPTAGASEVGGTPKAELSGVMERREMP